MACMCFAGGLSRANSSIVCLSIENLTMAYWNFPPSSLLNDPNTSSPANVEASNLYKDNRREYTKRVRETVEKSWDD